MCIISTTLFAFLLIYQKPIKFCQSHTAGEELYPDAQHEEEVQDGAQRETWPN